MNLSHWARGQWDRIAAWVLIALGGLAIVLGWLGVRGEALTQKQIPYIISGGIGGLFLLAVGAMLWLSADLRDEWRKLDAIERTGAPVPTTDTDDPFAPEPAVEPEMVVEPEPAAPPAGPARKPRKPRTPRAVAPS